MHSVAGLGVLSRAVATVLSVVSPAPSPDAARAPAATVVFAGDVVPHGDLLRSFDARGPASLLGPVAPALRAADLALVNLETPVVPAAPVARAGLRFNVHADFVDALVSAGVDAASVANNHSYDRGPQGVAATLRTVLAAGVRPIGGALGPDDPYVPHRFALAGSTLCVMAATRLLNYPWAAPTERQPRVAQARAGRADEQRRLLATVRARRAGCGALIVSLHSGREYTDAPLPGDRAFFRAVADAGADAVIGHHSHTPQPVELYAAAGGRSVPIFYSLGNLVSNQGNHADCGADPRPRGRWTLALDARTREGLLAVLRFEPATDGRLRVAEFGYVPLWTVNTRAYVAPGEAPTVAAALMPRDGGSDALLRQRWASLLARVGPAHLLPAAALPGAAAAYRASEQAVAANRERAATELTSELGPVASRRARRPQ